MNDKVNIDGHDENMKSEFGGDIKKTLVMDGYTNFVLGIVAASKGLNDSECIRVLIKNAITPEIQALVDAVWGKK